MLKEFDRKSDKLSGDERKQEIKKFQKLLTEQQMKIAEEKLPVIVLVEGWAAAGKGTLINELTSEVDPRFYKVFSTDTIGMEEDRYPFLYPYFNAIPENGKLLFMDGGWMNGVVTPYMHGEISKKEYKRRIKSINKFERTLINNGYVLIKLFVNIDYMEQRKRIDCLSSSSNTDWRVSSEDIWQNGKYQEFQKAFDDFMDKTSDVTEWNIVSGNNKNKLYYDSFKLITEKIGSHIESGKYNGPEYEEKFPMAKTPKLEEVDLSVSIPDEKYKRKLEKLQMRLSELHNMIYRMKIPVVIVFEGWDAAGKGGAIRRLSYPLDPRGCEVMPIASPEPHELANHFLWRFWKRLPKSGHITIFDRSWYGRVMVERIEGFCTENDWKRAYNEMNEFEQELTEYGAVVLKFWIQIDSDTQLSRFNDRQNDPKKQWKITDEDWRNREKWSQYEEAVSEMLEKTSTKNAPWHIVESVDKKYARIKVLEIVSKALEKAIDERRKKIS